MDKVQIGMDLHHEAKLVRQRTHDDAVDGTKHHENEDHDGETDESDEYTEAARNPQNGGRLSHKYPDHHKISKYHAT